MYETTELMYCVPVLALWIGPALLALGYVAYCRVGKLLQERAQ